MHERPPHEFDPQRGVSAPTRLLQRVVDVKSDEVGVLLWSCLYFFCLLSSYFILRPLREQMGIARGADKLPWFFTGTLIGMLIANLLFAWIATRHPRRVFVPWVYRFCIANLLLFYVLLVFFSAATSAWIPYVFFAWVSVFGLFVVSLFWSFMADLFDMKQGKRLFGFIGVGGTLGALAGSALTGFFAAEIGWQNLLLVSVVLLEASVRCVRVLVRICRVPDEFAKGAPSAVVQRAPASVEKPVEETERGGLLTGIRLVFQSPYLASICLYTFFYTLSSTFMYFEQQHIVEGALKDPAARTELFGRIDFSVQVLTVLVQAFLTGRIVAKLGIGFALISQPLLALAGFASLGVSPALAIVIVFQVLLRTANNATAKPSREMLFTVVGREVKYKSKSFIDTFVYRTGDQIAIWTSALLHETLGLGLSGVALAAVPLSIAWIFTGTLLGRRQKALAAHVTSAAEVIGEAPASRVQA